MSRRNGSSLLTLALVVTGIALLATSTPGWADQNDRTQLRSPILEQVKNGGDTCATATAVVLPAAIPFTDATVTTNGFVNDYANTCLGTYDDGPDVIYEITATTDTCAVFTYTPTVAGDWPGMALDSVCPLDPGTSDCLYKATSGGAPLSFTANLVAGTYWLQIDNWPSPAFTAGTLTISACAGPQAGDTCASAEVIPSLPFLDDGTTLGFNNDYDAVCNYAGSTAPDYVYSYTPSVDQNVDISLCDPGTATDYDTKVYVYENACTAGTEIACNDDACSSPSYANYVSELVGVALTAGNTYYIVVDGYLTSTGPYTLSIDEGQPPVPPPTCDDVTGANLLYSQDVHNISDAWSAAASTQATWAGTGYVCAENFDATVGTDWFEITDLHVFGLSLVNTGTWVACDPTLGPMTFDIVVYNDNAGLPGTAICTYDNLRPVIVNTGTSPNYAGFDLWEFDFDPLTPACNVGAVGIYWVSVQSEAMTPDCGFLWMSSGMGDSFAVQDVGAGWAPINDPDPPYHLSICITGNLVGPVPQGLISFSVE